MDGVNTGVVMLAILPSSPAFPEILRKERPTPNEKGKHPSAEAVSADGWLSSTPNTK